MIDNQNEMIGKILTRLNERVKELDCIYRVEEVLRDKEINTEKIFFSLLELIPPGWQYPAICEVRILFEGKEFVRPDFVETEWMHSADIIIDNNIAGCIQVFYSQLIRIVNGSQFLAEEQKLLNTIADRLSNFIFSKRLRKTLNFLKTNSTEPANEEEMKDFLPSVSDEHWKWRLSVAQIIADKIDMERMGVHGIYIIGSTKNALAGPASDIDLIMHFNGDVQQRRELVAWVEGWGQALAEMNFYKTGLRCDNLIDLHIVNDEDIKNKTSFAVMINSLTDGARLLRSR
jgi:hypothetical protein